MNNVAIVLAAGKGKRMNTKLPKQFLLLKGKPLIYYSLKIFEESKDISSIILVSSREDTTYCRESIVNKYGFKKVTDIVEGGQERYLSVYAGLCAITEADYVFIHDGARPFVDESIINRTLNEVKKCKACVAAMPVKDTIKIVNDDGYALDTPQRSSLWMVQTPQVFQFELIKEAYAQLIRKQIGNVTDDAMVIERMTDVPVKMVEGSYRNIKITTPEDLEIAEKWL